MLGYGPRFLHSTGQLHKGGPNTGLFLQILDTPAKKLPVPETDYTFGELIQAHRRRAITRRSNSANGALCACNWAAMSPRASPISKRRCVPEVTALFWDLGGVVLTNGWDRTGAPPGRREIPSRLGRIRRSPRAAFERIRNGRRFRYRNICRRTVFYRERPFTRDDFKKFVFERSQPLPESLEVLAQVAKTKKYLIAALNNESFEINEYRIDTFHLRGYFNAVLQFLLSRRAQAG